MGCHRSPRRSQTKQELSLGTQGLKEGGLHLIRGAVRGSSANLARVMGMSQATVRSWLTDPDDDTTYRRMTRGARRLLATMVLLDGAGLPSRAWCLAVLSLAQATPYCYIVAT